MDSNMKNLKKTWLNSLSFLDNCTINSIIVVILLLYSSQIFRNINTFIGNFYNFGIVRLIVLILIIYIAPKDPTIAILLAVSYIVSLHFMIENEYFSAEEEEGKKKSSILNMGAMNARAPMNTQAPMNSQAQMNSQAPMNSQTQMNSKAPMNAQANSQKVPFKPSVNIPQNNMMKMKENFIPRPNMYEEQNSDSYKPVKKSNPKTTVTSNQPVQQVNKQSSQQNVLNNKECMNMYTPRFESLSDVCTPTATFKNELNAQGLNFPEGFDSTVVGSPLN